jgi:hypothetical protein
VSKDRASQVNGYRRDMRVDPGSSHRLGGARRRRDAHATGGVHIARIARIVLISPTMTSISRTTGPSPARARVALLLRRPSDGSV